MSHLEIHNYTCTLSAKDLDKANRELNEDPQTRQLEIQTLRERLLRYPGLRPRVDDAFLLRFLRPRKFDQERTFELVLNYYKMKKDNEDLYAKMTPRHILSMLKSDFFTVIPQASKYGETVVVFRSGKWDPAKNPAEDLLKISYILGHVITESEQTQVNGVRYINDLTGMNWSHVTAVSPTMAQKMVHLMQDAFPLRLKGVHYVNEPSVFDYIFALIKPFLKEKITKRLHTEYRTPSCHISARRLPFHITISTFGAPVYRWLDRGTVQAMSLAQDDTTYFQHESLKIHFHGSNYEELRNFIHPECLPEEYGGKLSSVSYKEYGERVLQRQAYFEEEAKFGFVSMTIKKDSKKSEDAVESLPGTFKKLNID